MNNVIFTDIIATFINQKRAFTVYEVFLESKNNSVTSKYLDVKKDIHNNQKLKDEMSFGSYRRTLIPVKGQMKAWLYHDENYDVSQYNPLTMNNVVTPFGNNAVSNTVVTGNGNANIGHILNYRNQLFVYTKFLREIDAQPHDSVALITDPLNNKLYITKDLDEGKIQKVERNGDIRISYSNLTLAGLTKNHQFQIKLGEYNNKPAIEIFNIESDGTKI